LHWGIRLVWITLLLTLIPSRLTRMCLWLIGIADFFCCNCSLVANYIFVFIWVDYTCEFFICFFYGRQRLLKWSTLCLMQRVPSIFFLFAFNVILHWSANACLLYIWYFSLGRLSWSGHSWSSPSWMWFSLDCIQYSSLVMSISMKKNSVWSNTWKVYTCLYAEFSSSSTLLHDIIGPWWHKVPKKLISKLCFFVTIFNHHYLSSNNEMTLCPD
jgi:hypothetical protein